MLENIDFHNLVVIIVIVMLFFYLLMDNKSENFYQRKNIKESKKNDYQKFLDMFKEKILKVKPHVLRFWEEAFSQVKPLKRKGGRRLYSEDVINILRIIKKLVNDEGYSIRGVKKYLSKNKISDIKKKGAIKISEELDIKLDNIEKYLKKARSILLNE